MTKAKQEATLVIVKPDGIKKSLTGNILSRLSETKLRIIACKMKEISKELAEEHYMQLKDQPFFADLIKYIMGAFHTRRVMVLIYYGPSAIGKVREISGATNPEEADPVSIRGSYGRITTQGVFENVIHASANAEDAEREIKLWFKPDELTETELYVTKTASYESEQKDWA